MSVNPDLDFDAATRFAADLIRIPSLPGEEEAVAMRVVAEMERLGYHEAGTDAVGNAIGVIRGRGAAPPLMLSCHLDIVDPGDPHDWEHPPYGGVMADGALHGRGAMDIKGPLAVQTYAAARFAHEPPAGDLIVAHTTFEERGGWGMAHLLETLAPHPGAVVIGEATGGDVCIGHRGRAEVLVEVRGVAGHASAPERASNALGGVGQVLAAVEDFAAERLTRDDPLLGRSTIVATGVTTSPTSRNVIPDTATVALDWRLLPGATPQQALDELRGFLLGRVALPQGLSMDVRYTVDRQRSWTGLECDWEMAGPGFLLDPGHPLPTAAARAVLEATGHQPAVRPWRFATDGRHTAADHGIPTIGYAPGREAHAHTNRERLDLEEARVIYHAYPAVIRALFTAMQTHAS
jgi:succinyl-diaminopimelate desuccinylase